MCRYWFVAFLILTNGALGQQPASNATYFKFTSEPGDYIGQGKTAFFAAPDEQFIVEATAYMISIRLPRPGALQWQIAFQTGLNRFLFPGKYEFSGWPSFGNEPSLLLAGDGRGCGGAGRFEILDLAFEPDATVARFHATFEHRCGSASAALRGEVKITNSVNRPAPLTAGLYFVPVSPCRIADTRENLGTFGKPALTAGVERTFEISKSACRLPLDAKAYSLNVTVAPKGPLGYVTLWPAGRAAPYVSTLNSLDGRVKANAAIVPAGDSGAINVLATDPTELILDVNGYFVEPNVTAAGLAFYPIPPCRIADTREASGLLGGPRIEGGSSRSFPVLNANCGIPATAQAYSLNATVVPGGPLGYISMWPTGQAQPFVSTLNAPTGAIVANAAIVPAGTGGAVSVFAQGPTHLVLDVNGYFAPPGGPSAQRFYPLPPCRVLDTRFANGQGPRGLSINSLSQGETRILPVTLSNCGLPSFAGGYSLNATAATSWTLGYMTLWPTGQQQPFVSTLNAIDDRVVANAALLATGERGQISVYVTDDSALILDTNGFFAP